MSGRQNYRLTRPPVRGEMEKRKKTRQRRLILLIAGIILVAVGGIIIFEATSNIVGYEQLTAEKLQEAEELVAEMRPSEPVASGAAAQIPSGSEAPSGSPAASAVEVPGPLINQPIGSVLGIIEFESLGKRRVPIIEGAEPKQLAEGAGHHQDMAYPGQSGNCLIFGHRNTVFRGFGKLQKGDLIKLETKYGTFTYKISDMQVAQPLAPLMFKGYREPMLTLVTCYPFDYVGAAPKRYIVVCTLDSSSVAPAATPNKELEGN
jgi:sortase A